MSCLEKDCRDCDWHVIRNDRLDCNHNNRLGLGQIDITQLLQEDPTIEKEENPDEE